jgi:hypothetical protein
VVEWDGIRVTVDAMDGRRIEQLVVTKVARQPPADGHPDT